MIISVIVYTEETIMNSSEETILRKVCNEIQASAPTVLSNFEYILPNMRERTISSIFYIEETVLKTRSSHIISSWTLNCIFPKNIICVITSSKFPEIIICLIVYIEETVMKTRPSHVPRSWVLSCIKNLGNDQLSQNIYRRMCKEIPALPHTVF